MKELHEIMYVNYIAKDLALSKHSVNESCYYYYSLYFRNCTSENSSEINVGKCNEKDIKSNINYNNKKDIY